MYTIYIILNIDKRISSMVLTVRRYGFETNLDLIKHLKTKFNQFALTFL